MFDFLNINWEKLNSPVELATLVVIVSAVGVAIWYTLNRKKSDAIEKLDQRTILSYKERLEVVEKETKDCHEQHADSIKQISELRGELKAYKALVLIPADFLKELQRNQMEIIKLLKEGRKK